MGMKLQLESLKYQEIAIQSVVKVFEGTQKNNFDNATFNGIRANVCQLTTKQINENLIDALEENGVDLETARLSAGNDLCIEMETGTGKTLVYLKTIYELYKHYGFTKFIILVPSVAIRQGVLTAFKIFEKQLKDIYGFTPKLFEYDSKRLNKVANFIEEQHLQVMVMTLASFNSEDKILNQAQREDLFANIPFIDAIGKTNPFLIMDEPQEGMDTDNSIKQISKLNPLFKIRYSATHKVMKNLIYRLTPYDSYKQGLVKKIEVLTVSEKNDEATIKIELTEIQISKTTPKAKVKAWKLKGGKFRFEETNWLKIGDNLGEKTNNPSYLNYNISRIWKPVLRVSEKTKWKIEFSNGVVLEEKQTSGNIQSIWALQLKWLIRRHFTKSKKLTEQGIKCLSLIFIDRVANYVGENPVIKNLFSEKYKQVYSELNNGNQPTDEHIRQIQGYYFAQKGSGEFADNEGGQKEQKRVYELILKGKEELLNISNPVQFIFSHSALGVGWDNPNVFNIATLNTAYSEIRKRQEIGRGLRICVNQDGQRIYDRLDKNDTARINQLTVIPNETYETFVTQYQEEIREIYGTNSAGAGFTHTHQGKPQNEVHFKRTQNETMNTAFIRFWKLLAKKTDYTAVFNETSLVSKAIEEINKIYIADYVAEVSSRSIEEVTSEGVNDYFGETTSYSLKAHFTPLDLVEELSENTGITNHTLFSIFRQITNYEQFVKNPPQYIHHAAAIIRNIELNEMIKGLDYHLTGEEFPFQFDDFVKNISAKDYVETPNKGVFDKMLVDNDIETSFAKAADMDDEIICFLKLPTYYNIKTPIGEYQPDFGLVMKHKSLRKGNENEFYFVVETKGTNDMNDKKTLSETETYRIHCAVKHFKTIGLDVYYKAPVKEYIHFRTEAVKIIHSIIEPA